MAEFKGARIVVFVLRSARRDSMGEEPRASEEKVVRERWVPRMSARGTEGCWGGLLLSLLGGGMAGREPWRGCWRMADACENGRRRDEKRIGSDLIVLIFSIDAGMYGVLSGTRCW